MSEAQHIRDIPPGVMADIEAMRDFFSNRKQRPGQREHNIGKKRGSHEQHSN